MNKFGFSRLPVVFMVALLLASPAPWPGWSGAADESVRSGADDAGAASRPPDREFLAVATGKAVERYTQKLEEIERVATLRRKEARDDLMRALKATQQIETERGPRYRGMVGTYYHGNRGRTPFILLNVPDGTNVFGQTARDILNGRVDLSQGLYRFEARGHVIIPKDGTYHLEAGRGHGQFKLNGKGYRLTSITSLRSGADVKLEQGVYDVLMTVGNNGGQLGAARVVIADKETGRPLPVFIYESELHAAFSEGRTAGLEPIEVSHWSPEKNRLRRPRKRF